MGDFMQFDLSFTRDEGYECGAALLAVLVCAKTIDDERGRQLYLSLCARALRLKHSANPDDRTPITARPEYLFRNPHVIDRDLKFVSKRLGERIIAATMAIPFVRQAKIGPIKRLPEGIKRISINEIAGYEYVLQDAGQADPQNLKKRFWAPSRPVIHLATAALVVGKQRQKTDVPIAPADFLLDRRFVESVVWLAGQLQDLIAKNPKFPVKADQLIDFRLG